MSTAFDRSKETDLNQAYAEFKFAQYSATLITLSQHIPIDASRTVASNVTLEELFGR